MKHRIWFWLGVLVFAILVLTALWIRDTVAKDAYFSRSVNCRGD